MGDPATSLYYLYSTLSQTMAGAAGFLAAVAAYKLKELDDQIAPDAGTLVALWNDVGQGGPEADRSIWDAWRRRDYTTMLTRLEADHRWEQARRAEYDRFVVLAKRYRSLLNALKWALILTGLTVLSAIIVLAIIQTLGCGMACALLIAGPIAGAACLVSYVFVVRSMFTRATG
jgi:hypothetical protein